MLTKQEWIEKYGNEPCDGCQYNIPHRAKCTYKQGFCIRYDLYKRDFKRQKPKQLNLFESED